MEIDDVLSKIPKRSPTWAVGIVTIIISITTSLVTVYMFSKEDIRKYTANNAKTTDVLTAARVRQDGETLTAVLSLVQNNQQQIVSLSTALGETQQQNIVLTIRVDALEKSLIELKTDLSVCQAALKVCIDKKQ